MPTALFNCLKFSPNCSEIFSLNSLITDFNSSIIASENAFDSCSEKLLNSLNCASKPCFVVCSRSEIFVLSLSICPTRLLSLSSERDLLILSKLSIISFAPDSSSAVDFWIKGLTILNVIEQKIPNIEVANAIFNPWSNLGTLLFINSTLKSNRP